MEYFDSYNENLKMESEPDEDGNHENDHEDEHGDERQSDPSAGRNIGGIIQSGSIVTKNKGVTLHSVTLIGQIEGHYALPPNSKSTKYEHIIPLLVAVEENPEIDGLLIILNTVGGDVEAGLALSEMIASMSKPTVSLVLGGGHSIGVPLAVSARRSLIAPSATMTVHPVRMNGLVLGVEQSFNYFLRMQERINNFIVSHSHIDESRLEQIMYNKEELTTDVGSIIESRQAVECGLIDAIGGLKEALGELRSMIGDTKEKKADDL